MQRILIVEDDEAIAQLEKDYLEVNNYEVTVENNGEVGLKRAIEGDYDLFILDLMLPQMDGFEVCQKIREVKNTPILLVSAKKDDIDKIRGLGLGADDYITKPFSPGELVARVKAHMSRFERLVGSNAPGKKNVIEIRGLRIDTDSRIVSVNGEDVQLSSKEFELLLFLVENPNRVISKEELFQAIWGQASFGDAKTVTVHIKKVREKIEIDSSKPQYIETIWGIGYRFRV
ncbi:MAG: response regulator transcription factor [Lachnospiraceae bacterium]|nr:response regulator transcription factor [Lachnospiraceae bacterium]MBQ9391402.1 response regulator transcription factor [Lachnospiraceae bacterium]